MKKTSLILFAIANFSLIYSMKDAATHKKELSPIIEDAKSLIREKCNQVPPFIAIAGCSGVGKSHLAKELTDILQEEGITAKILNCDDFLNPYHNDPDHFHPRFEHLLAHAVIQKIKQGAKSITKPAWNPAELRPPAKIQENFLIERVDLIIFEGEFTLCEQAPYDFRKYSDLGIFVDADDEDIMEWNWQRKRSDTKNTTQEEYKARIKSNTLKYRDFVKSCWCRYLVSKNSDHQYRVIYSP